MHSSSAQTKHKIQIPHAQIEYTGVFKEPLIRAFAPPAALVEDLFRALKPYGFPLEGVELRNNQKVSDIVVELRRTPPLTSLKISPGKVNITADNLDWSDKDRFIKGMNVALQTVLGREHSEFEMQHMVLAMHVQLQEKPRKDITASLLSTTAYSLLPGESDFQGIVLTRVGVSLVIDASQAYANALFMRLVRQHKPTTTLEQIAEQLYADEVHIFDVLGLEGDL